MYIGPHVKYPSFLFDFNETCIFLDRFSKNSQISNYMNIRPVGAELFHADRRTGGQTWRSLIVAFRNFANSPKKESIRFCSYFVNLVVIDKATNIGLMLTETL